MQTSTSLPDPTAPDFATAFKAMLTGQLFDFEDAALAVFRYQAQHCPIYARWVAALGIAPSSVRALQDIPFLPISFFKTHVVLSDEVQARQIFESSGTTGAQTSRHYVADPDFYAMMSLRTFEQVYGPLEEWVILALLPSYMERGQSSLVFMVEQMIRRAQPDSGFFLRNYAPLIEKIRCLVQKRQKVMLIGVTFALLELAEQYAAEDFASVRVMETGGMKGRRREMVREEVHAVLQQAWGVKDVHSEYGMTELLSQAYAPQRGIFRPAPTMRLLAREINDPFGYVALGRQGGLNIIDLANVESCAFLQTQDVGNVHEDGTFEVLGRFDNSDVRGCNLLVS